MEIDWSSFADKISSFWFICEKNLRSWRSFSKNELKQLQGTKISSEPPLRPTCFQKIIFFPSCEILILTSTTPCFAFFLFYFLFFIDLSPFFLFFHISSFSFYQNCFGVLLRFLFVQDGADGGPQPQQSQRQSLGCHGEKFLLEYCSFSYHFALLLPCWLFFFLFVNFSRYYLGGIVTLYRIWRYIISCYYGENSLLEYRNQGFVRVHIVIYFPPSVYCNVEIFVLMLLIRMFPNLLYLFPLTSMERTLHDNIPYYFSLRFLRPCWELFIRIFLFFFL